MGTLKLKNMDFYYHPVLGLQYFGNLRKFNYWLIDEIGQFPIDTTPFILSNTTHICKTKKVKFKTYI